MHRVYKLEKDIRDIECKSKCDLQLIKTGSDLVIPKLGKLGILSEKEHIHNIIKEQL